MLNSHDVESSAGKLGHHFVQFYRDDALLIDEVVDFIEGALLRGETGVVIATAGHRTEIERRLHDAHGAVSLLQGELGEYIALDAGDTLATFMRGDWPDEQLFNEVVGGVIHQASKNGTCRVHAFGEMVALLCERGNPAAAIRLEELWNRLTARYEFSLFCAYPLSLFNTSDMGTMFRKICTHHSHVLPPEFLLAHSGSEGDSMVVSQLRRNAAALEAEVVRRTLAEKTLRARQKELTGFLDNAAEGLNRIDPDGVVLWANRAELELLGLARSNYVGLSWSCVHANQAEGEAIVQRMRAGEVLYNEAATLRCADGSIRHVLIHTTPVFDHGDLKCTRCFTRDVTEQQQARLVLEKANEERTRLLRELASANRAKDEFLAMLGHELRNPLAPIVTALQLMKMRGDRDTSNEQAIIQRQVEHLIRLVDDLLDVSKITRGKIELRKEQADIASVITNAVEMASPLIERRRHRLVVHAPSTGMRWVGDPIRLAQVVSNLLTNAARYTPDGGEIVLTARSDARDRDVVISVRDSGIGIAPNMLNRVFDLFVQGERGVDRAEGGLGIGLALVKSLVRLHGGTVSARSDGLGLGSEFIVRLPIETSAGVAQPVPKPLPAERPVFSGRVLVVDDNADAADTLGLTLRAQGHEVKVAHDPAAALAAVETFVPDVAVLDIGLPAMDGYELGARLREVVGCGTCRFIALTGYSQESDHRRSNEAGFHHHLVKPVDLDLLTALVAAEAAATRAAAAC